MARRKNYKPASYFEVAETRDSPQTNQNTQKTSKTRSYNNDMPKPAEKLSRVIDQSLIDIVIVNWNAHNQLDACLGSLPQPISENIFSVIIVDNSREKNLNTIRTNYPFCRIITPQTNLGFGGGCNLGAMEGSAPFIIFLNPDILFTTGSVDQLVQFLESQALPKDVGIIGAQLLNPDGSIQRNIARFPRFGDLFPRMIGLDKLFPQIFPPHYQKDLDYSAMQKVEQVPGAFFLVRRSLFESLHGFDENFFMYYEDVDFSYRSFLEGWRSLYLPQVKVIHAGGGTTDTIKATRLFYVLRSKILYARKHFGNANAAVLIMGIFSLELIGRIANAIIHFSGEQMVHTLTAYAKLSIYLINIRVKKEC